MNWLHVTNMTFGSPPSDFLWSRWPTSCWLLSPVSTINQFNYIFPQLSECDLPDGSIFFDCVWEKGLIDDLIIVMHSVAILQKLPHSSEVSFIQMFLDSYLNFVLILWRRAYIYKTLGSKSLSPAGYEKSICNSVISSYMSQHTFRF